MASSKCSVSSCKRDFDVVCGHCQNNVCSKHYVEHVKLANDELLPLADQLNALIDSIQQQQPLRQAFEQLEQWRENAHQNIDQIYEHKKRELETKMQEDTHTQMNRLRELSQRIKELLDEGDASFKQIEKIKSDIKECQEENQKLQNKNSIRLRMKPVQFETYTLTGELFTGGCTLLSLEQQMQLNELYGKANQKWMLIYKATRDGFGSKDFHRCCDNKGPTMTVIESKNGGYLFGGYTSTSWRSSQKYLNDSNSPFLFTLKNPHGIPPTKYPVKFAEYSICDTNHCGPTFGRGHDLNVCDYSQAQTNSYINFPHSYTDTTNRGNTTFTGSSKYQTNDIEVFRLIQ